MAILVSEEDREKCLPVKKNQVWRCRNGQYAVVIGFSDDGLTAGLSNGQNGKGHCDIYTAGGKPYVSGLPQPLDLLNFVGLAQGDTRDVFFPLINDQTWITRDHKLVTTQVAGKQTICTDAVTGVSIGSVWTHNGAEQHDAHREMPRDLIYRVYLHSDKKEQGAQMAMQEQKPEMWGAW